MIPTTEQPVRVEPRLANTNGVARSDDTAAPAHVLTAHPAIGRASAAFVERFVVKAAAICGGSILDAILCMALLDGNTRHISSDDCVKRHGGAALLVSPDEVWRPLSIHGIATSLSLPFETVRRRIRALVARGMCAFVPAGVVVAEAQLASPGLLKLSEETYGEVRDLYALITRHSPTFDPLGRADAPVAPRPSDADAVWMVSRAALAYVLRYMESVDELVGSLLDGAILLAVFNHNVARQDLRTARWVAPQAGWEILSDDLRTRTPIFALARAMNLSPETVRRRIHNLLDRGLCERDHKGIYVPGSVLASRPMQQHWDLNMGGLQRLFGDLQRVGLRFD